MLSYNEGRAAKHCFYTSLWQHILTTNYKVLQNATQISILLHNEL